MAIRTQQILDAVVVANAVEVVQLQNQNAALPV